jgi:type IV pilus assembly protein PilY1
MKRNTARTVLGMVAALIIPLAAVAQSVNEDFTQPAATQSWWFFNGACLTASTAAGSEPSTGSGGSLPGCTTIQPTYYRENLVGGMQLTNTTPDNPGQGALRFTNGSPGGYSQNGGIVSTIPFPTGQGVAITFKTVTYLGNSGGGGKDGADGISFFLMDASKLNTSTITGVANGDGNGLGSWGGSLGYTCSNSNPPYNGLIGGYLGLGIDEYGNFLNGSSNTLGETGTSATGDNTASGGGYQPGRIGLRGAGNVAWNTLNGAYGTNLGSALPYYPSSLKTSCLNAGGTYNANTTTCQNCGSGTYSGAGGGSCNNICSSGTYNANTNLCEICSKGNYNAGTNSCTAGGTLTTATPTSTGPSNGRVDAFYAVQKTCRDGTLYNYSTANSPTSAGATSLTNTANTGNASATPAIAPILDYGALPNGYLVLPGGTQIAAEGATKRSQATPIFYQLKISQNGFLSLAYATCPPASTSGCSAYTQVIKNYNITTSNGPLPANFLFGFAGSTGGSTNVHEILCFKADPATSAAGSAAASERQSAKLENGIQAYFAYYNPSNGWTGRVTASSLAYDTYGNITIAATPNWDGSCVLTGGTCTTTGQTGMVAQVPANRNILSWNGATGVAFAYTSLSGAQQTAIDLGDTTANPPAPSLSSQMCYPKVGPAVPYWTAARIAYLGGDRTCEVNSSGQGLFRRRSSVLGDVMDSSPVWVGMPDAPYSAMWVDRINAADPLSENASGAPTYPAFVTGNQNRTQVVYVGSNDGLVHGFRSGYFNLPNPACTGANPPATCFTNNDGLEMLAYMPGAVVNNIHQWSNAAATASNPNPAGAAAQLDFSNPQYGHNFYVNATPYAGDLFYGNQWHTWLVGGLGDGGAAIYALDITNPGTTSTTGSTPNNPNDSAAEQFVVGGAPNASLVMGEWTPTSITCSGNATCGINMGNSFGTPQIRRLHDGNWGVIFGNGFSSCTGDAGIYVGVVNPASAALTFYYISTNTGTGSSGSCLTSGGNGIAYVTPADLDGDHITDYVYAGDLNGNVWRFDLTSANESTWTGTAPYKVFATPAGQPITTQLSVASGPPAPGLMPQVMVLFGTGQKTEVSNSSGATYSTGQQTLYGVWDWNMTSWNSKSTNTQYSSEPVGTIGLVRQGNLTAQVATAPTCNNGACSDVEIQNNATVCWFGQTFCASNNNSFGWYLNLPSTQEQIIYNPELVAQAITVNSVVPAQNSPTSCSNNTDIGYTYVLNAINGNAFFQVFLPPAQVNNPLVNSTTAYTDTKAIAMQTNATGSSFVTTNATGVSYLIYETNTAETVNGNILQGGSLGLNLPPNTTGRRLSWIELR